MQRILIVGAGLAGGTAATTLREAGFEGEVTLLGQEERPPYHRPPLSKTYLRGEEPLEQLALNPEDAYAGQRIELRRGARARSIDARARYVELEGGERLGYDRLLVTTGGRNRRLPVPGADLDGVHQLRTVDDSDAI